MSTRTGEDLSKTLSQEIVQRLVYVSGRPFEAFALANDGGSRLDDKSDERDTSRRDYLASTRDHKLIRLDVLRSFVIMLYRICPES